VLAEILANQDPQPLENLVADAVAVLLVDRRQAIDVEEDQRDAVAEPAGALELLGEDGVEQRPVCSVVSLSMTAVSLGSSCALGVGASRSNDARRTSCATSGHGSLVAPSVSFSASSSSACVP
jgi:hypothetical protein